MINLPAASITSAFGVLEILSNARDLFPFDQDIRFEGFSGVDQGTVLNQSSHVVSACSGDFSRFSND